MLGHNNDLDHNASQTADKNEKNIQDDNVYVNDASSDSANDSSEVSLRDLLGVVMKDSEDSNPNHSDDITVVSPAENSIIPPMPKKLKIDTDNIDFLIEGAATGTTIPAAANTEIVKKKRRPREKKPRKIRKERNQYRIVPRAMYILRNDT